MKMDKANIKSLFIIVNAGYSDEVVGIARALGATGATILQARGEGSRHEVVMGITVDAEKEMILCLVTEQVADKIMAAVKERAGIKTPAHGVCFTMPVDKIMGIAPAPLPPA